jgi:hypothetical protein
VAELVPEELGLSADLVALLAERLARWAPWASVGATAHLDEPEPEWVAGQGEWLHQCWLTRAYAVQHELGLDVEVLLEGTPVHGRRGP